MKEKLTPQLEDNITKFIFYKAKNHLLNSLEMSEYDPKELRKKVERNYIRDTIRNFLKDSPEKYLKKLKLREKSRNTKRGIIQLFRTELEEYGDYFPEMRNYKDSLYTYPIIELLNGYSDTSLYEFEYDPEHEFFQEIFYLKLQGVI